MGAKQGVITNAATEYPLTFGGYGATRNANTLYLWGFSGETVVLQVRPGLKNANGSEEWFDVETFTAKTAPPYSFVGKASGYRLLVSSADEDTAIRYTVL